MAVSRLSTSSIQSGFPKYQTAWDGVSAAGAMDAISFVQVPSGGLSSIEFNNIPQTYSHLQLRVFAKVSGSSANQMPIRFNNDSGSSSYSDHNLRGNGSSASSGGDATGAYTYIDRIPGSGVGSNIFGATVIDIYDYTDTHKTKTLRAFGGYDANGSGLMTLNSGLWNSTSAITSISITDSYIENSHFALYGIK